MAVAHQIIIIDPSEAFITSLCGGGLSPSRTQSLPKTTFLFDAAAASSSDNGAKEGGTEWIKDSIGTSNNNSSSSQPETSSPPSQRLEFSIVEVKEMEKLIIDLSKEQNDNKRRLRLADIFDKELAAAASVETTITASSSSTVTTTSTPCNDNNSGGSGREIPRFAQLFQYSLDNVGEMVQNAAREKAAMDLGNYENNSSASEGNNTDSIGGSSSSAEQRVKSEEELQLWALIDMMVQSKTRVKMYMGSLGSKGAFR
jgi:flagellar hook-basal body complex protein FliE